MLNHAAIRICPTSLRSSSSPLSARPISSCSGRPSTSLIESFLRSFLVLFRVETGLLCEVGAHEIVSEVVHLPQHSILGLQVLRQLRPLHQRRVLPLQLPLQPLLPGLTWVNHWVLQLDLFLLEEVGHFLSRSALYQSFQELLVVDVPIRVLLAQLRVGLRILKGFLLLPGQMAED